MKDAIIVADDSAIIQNIIKKSFEGELSVLTANNGREVIDILNNNKEFNIQCILLDLNMPEYDGFMVLNYFKNNNLFRKFPISIISGDDTKETMERAFKYEIIDMLNKPFSQENIRNIVNKTINSK